MLIRHKVADFNTWKVGYDAHQAMRTEAGLTEKYPLRSTDDSDEVVALFEARDIDRAKAFAASAELREKMQELGVADRLDIDFLNSATWRGQCLTIHSCRSRFAARPSSGVRQLTRRY